MAWESGALGMKKVLASLFLVGLLFLSGCAARMDSDYLSIQPHQDNLTSENDPSVFRAETYTRLVDDIHSMVEAGLEHGVVHLSNYVAQNEKGDVETDLANACAEVAQHDPLGAYAVDFIKHDKTYIVSYYEANIYITYRRTQEQLASIASVTGTSAVRTEIQEALASFSTEKVLRISYFTEDAAAIQALIRQAYYALPQFALGMPEIEVNLYPSGEGYTDPLRIVEILLRYPSGQDLLKERAAELALRTQALGESYSDLDAASTARAISRTLNDTITLLSADEAKVEGGSTAYSALVEGRADSEGFALAFQLLAEQTALESRIISGSWNTTPHFWNYVKFLNGESLYYDAHNQAEGLSSAELAAIGYAWEE